MRRRFLNNIRSISNDYHSEYFTIEALEDGLTAKLSINACEYRIDNGNWNTLSANSNTLSINTGQTLSFKGNITPKSSSGIGTFTISKKCNLKGNIMSLLYGDYFKYKNYLTGKDYAFCGLFYNCKTVVDVSNLILPATTLVRNCYASMFEDCTSLTTSPELPATTLANYCYNRMFFGTNVLPDCSNIDFSSESVVASGGLKGLFARTKVTDVDLERLLPKNNEGKYCLPATKLTSYCYYFMFEGCTSLTKAPELPATTLADSCYQEMFKDCTSLTTAPELPATKLTSYCYYLMFDGCSNLNYIKMLATDISAASCLSSWVFGVASSGTFVKNADMTSLPTGSSGIPSGWEVKDHITPTECTSLTITADDVVGSATTTTIHYTAICNGVDYKGETVTGIVKEGTVVSSEFPQNTSETETVERTITFEFMGVTASTVITQGVWLNQSYILDLNNQWELSTTVSTPDSGLYDGVYQSFSNKGVNSTAAVMYVDIDGYSDFDLYIRSYAESVFDYVMVSQLDQTIDNNTSYSNSTLVKAHTRGNQKPGNTIYDYTKVSFTGIDAGQHRITIVYRKDSSSHSGDDRGYVLLLKNKNTSDEVNVITFTINGNEYQAEEDMTWEKWVNSSYNTNTNIIINNGFVCYTNNYFIMDSVNTIFVLPSAHIINKNTYVIAEV